MQRDLASSHARTSGTHTEPGRDGPPRASAESTPSRTSRLWPLVPLAVAALGILAYQLLDYRPLDLAAHVYRAELFEQEGWTIWNGQWYGGHHTPAYSVLFPPLAALFGPVVVGAASVLVSVVLFDLLVRREWGERARWGSLWFAAGVTAGVMITGRLTFGFGLAVGLAALMAFQRGRVALACGLAVTCALASPVAGAFLALAALAYGISGQRHVTRSGRRFHLRGLATSPGDVVLRLRGGESSEGESRSLGERARDLGLRPRGLVLAASALVPVLMLAVAFPEGGFQPFRFGVFWAAPVGAAIYLVVLRGHEPELRAAAAIYALAVTAAFVVDTPMGSNAVRLGALFGGPLLACAVLAHPRRRSRGRLAVLVAAMIGFAVWQWATPIRDYLGAHDDPGVKSSYYDPLLSWLDRHDDGPPFRVHIPFTRSHWEAATAAPHYPLARGWERQLDTGRNRIFYDGFLNPLTYAAWLSNNGVRYVALPSVKPDFSTRTERGLLERGLPYLKLVWRSKHWRVFELTLPHPLAVPDDDAQMWVTRLGNDEVDLAVRRPGEAVLRVRWSPYWRVEGGCIEEDGDWTRVTAREPGTLRVRMSFSPDRVIQRGRRCS